MKLAQIKGLFIFNPLFLCFFILLFWQNRSLFAQNLNIDSLFQVLRTTKIDTEKVNVLNALTRKNWQQGNYDSAFAYNKQATALAKRISFYKGMADAYNNLGLTYKYKGDYRDALLNYNKALKIFDSLRLDQGTANSYNNIGIVYRYLGNYPLALKNHLAALKLREKMNDQFAIASSNNNIGLVYFDQFNTKDALERYFAALAIFQKTNNKRALGDCYANIGGIYEYEKKYSEAVKCHLLSLEYRKQVNNKKGIADCYNNLGLTYFEQGDSAYKASDEGKHFALEVKYKESTAYFLKALELKEALRDKQGLADTYNNLGPLYIRLKDYSAARAALKKALSISLEIRVKDVASTSYLGLSRLDSAQGSFKEALNNYRTFILYRDSLNNDENTKKSVRMMMQFDFDKQQLADSTKNVELVKQEQLKHDQEIKQQKIYTYGGVIGFVLMLLVAGVSFKAFRNKQNANKIISIQKELVEDKQKEILDSIHYAKRIQSALLPTEKYISKNWNRLNK